MNRPFLFYCVIIFVLVISSITHPIDAVQNKVAEASKPIAFDRMEFNIGKAKRMTVLTGDLLGDHAEELVTVHVDKNGERRLKIYSADPKQSEPLVDVSLRREVLFVDVCRIASKDRLITYTPGQLNWFDPDDPSEKALLEATINFKPPRKQEVPHVDMTKDLNGDQRDDLVFPGKNGYRIFTQSHDGTFDHSVQLGSTVDLSGIYWPDGYKFDPWSQSRMHEVDFNQDAKIDLVYWDKDHFNVHLGSEEGFFSSKSDTFTTTVTFDTDNPYALSKGNMTGRALYSLTDVNGDGLMDMILFSLKGKRIASKKSAFEVHYGVSSTGQNVAFNKTPDVTFQSDSHIMFQMKPFDLDGNNYPDLMVLSVDRYNLSGSMWKSLKGLFGEDIRLRLEFYRGSKKGFSKHPVWAQTIDLDGPPSHREAGHVPLEIILRGATHAQRKQQKMWPRAFNATLLIGDFNGDGLSDMLRSSHPRGFGVAPGVAEKGLFSTQFAWMKMNIPNDEEYTWLVDINRDGKQDVLMHHPFPARDPHGAPIHSPGQEDQLVTLLIAK